MKVLIMLYTILITLDIYLVNSNPIITPYKELECSSQDDPTPQSRNKRAAKTLSLYPIWPNGIIPFHIDCPNFSKEDHHLLHAALGDIQSKTCVKFVHIKPDGNTRHFIRVQCQSDGGCKSELGYQGRPQQLNLQIQSSKNHGGCMTFRRIQHEFLHALGFRHEHNSPNRNKFVEIHPRNIARGWESYFDVDLARQYEYYGCPYDYNSVMSVDAFRHSGNGEATIVPLDRRHTVRTIGIAQRISECDVKRINNMYCPNRG